MNNIYSKLTLLQNELKAPKGQYNSFGRYKYRSAEDILEAVKPLLEKYKLTQFIADEVIQVGDSNYIKATVTLVNSENAEEVIYNTALARESLTKKGMDDSQITGTASSYARKYALNGIYAIDDTKDADTDEYQKQTKKQPQKNTVALITPKQEEVLKKAYNSKIVSAEELQSMIKGYGKSSRKELTETEAKEIIIAIGKIAKTKGE